MTPYGREFRRILRSQVELLAAVLCLLLVLRTATSDQHAVTWWTVIMAVLATLLFSKWARELTADYKDIEAMNVLVLPGDEHLQEALASMLDDPDGQLCEGCCELIVPEQDAGAVQPVEFMTMAGEDGGTRYWHSACVGYKTL